MYSFTTAFSFVLVAVVIGVQAETHTVHFQNKYALLGVVVLVPMLIQKTNFRLAVALERSVLGLKVQTRRLILLYSRL